MRVFVYFNLHRKVWSIKALEGPDKGRVIAHSKYVVLRNARGKVSQAGRQRVLREGRKNVHAGIVGDWSYADLAELPGVDRRVTYNPYKYETFVYLYDETPFEGSDLVVMTNKTVYAA